MYHGDAPVEAILDGLAVVEMAELASRGLATAAGHRTPATFDGRYPQIIHGAAVKGGRFRWSGGGEEIGGSDYEVTELHNLETILLVAPESESLAVFLVAAYPWIRLVPAAYALHQQLKDAGAEGALCGLMRAVAYKYAVVPLGDMNHLSVVFAVEAYVSPKYQTGL